MYKERTVAVVVPAHNEERLIGRVIESMPEMVDEIIVVDDCSRDRTPEIVESYKGRVGAKVTLIRHAVNQGVGGSIASGYKMARDKGLEIAVVMAGDAQMDPADLGRLLDPVAEGLAEYSKGNRLLSPQAWRNIPKTRYLGNSILSLLTKIASGYWHVMDSQTGYTAISLSALQQLDLDAMYKRYGMPNDLLVRLNVLDCRVIDVPIRPVYNIGEKSGIRISRVIFTISWLLLRLFFWRLREKYVKRDFHPLVFFYLLGFFLLPLGLGVGGAIVRYNTSLFSKAQPLQFGWLILCALLVTTGLQSLFFAMWFDMDYNRHLFVFHDPRGAGRYKNGVPV